MNVLFGSKAQARRYLKSRNAEYIGKYRDKNGINYWVYLNADNQLLYYLNNKGHLYRGLRPVFNSHEVYKMEEV